jgi:hypothetical protein
MAVSADRVRDLALAFPSVSEVPHWHRLAFRTPRKIFATLDTDARDLNLMSTKISETSIVSRIRKHLVQCRAVGDVEEPLVVILRQ